MKKNQLPELINLFAKLIIAMAVIGWLQSCGIVKQSVNSGVQRIMLQEETNDGRRLYAVLFKDGTALDFMYWEEVQFGLKTGKWGYDETR